MNAEEKKEYDAGYKDGIEGNERKIRDMCSWYEAGYANGQNDRVK